MQAPFWKADGEIRNVLESDFIAIARSCSEVSIQMIVVPLVDNGRLENQQQEEALLTFMLAQADLFRALDLRIIFECDFLPDRLTHFINQLPADIFGVNYDIGNSAALGYKPEEEFFGYGDRILNVHIKDRILGGTTVSLGSGNADFPTIFRLLNEVGYQGNLIMQTARASDGDHVGVLREYMDQIKVWAGEI